MYVSRPLPEPKGVVTLSLATLGGPYRLGYYFEDLYFPLLRQPPSREQRRLAMEKDILSMCLSEPRKEDLHAHWRENDTDYLRDQPRKADVRAFVKLKTITHSEYASGSLDCLTALKLPLASCVFFFVSGERTKHWQAVRYEAGAGLSR